MARSRLASSSSGTALPSRVGIVGLGLMGGSLALALERAQVRVTAVDPDPDARSHFKGRLARDAAGGPGPSLSDCDVIALAVHPDRLGEAAAAVRPYLGECAVVTDLTSVKAGPLATLAAALPHTRLVGSHPMAGRERSGAALADPHLFQGRPWALVPGARADAGALGRVRAIAEAVGAHCVEISAEAHDAAVAAVSHLPYLVSGALARAVDGIGGGDAAGLAGPGLEGMLRLAAQPSWMDVVTAQNAGNLRRALSALEAELARVRDALDRAQADPAALSALGEAGRQARARILVGGEGRRP